MISQSSKYVCMLNRKPTALKCQPQGKVTISLAAKERQSEALFKLLWTPDFWVPNGTAGCLSPIPDVNPAPTFQHVDHYYRTQ